MHATNGPWHQRPNHSAAGINCIDGSAELLSKRAFVVQIRSESWVSRWVDSTGNPALQATNGPWRRRPKQSAAGMNFSGGLLSKTSFRSGNPNRILGFSAESGGDGFGWHCKYMDVGSTKAPSPSPRLRQGGHASCTNLHTGHMRRSDHGIRDILGERPRNAL